ncbi:hypothetical protein JD844_011109 [Phrynosoma platyrhinos]|uniref:Peptidase S1 domain-containing protein n=1 Tax=Phrynosoma platyrhinos TaxID=52577 RepID=A0ABQ7TIE0_PHRPL|nr:hypothetical protein JD844_011109 [Phrynosoma platyrhinos]
MLHWLQSCQSLIIHRNLFCPRNRRLWRAAFGYHHLYKPTKYTKRSRINAIRIHSDFNKVTYDHDLALFQLSRPITYNNYIQPVCLPHSSLSLSKLTTCYITGWGVKKENGTGSYILQEAEVEIIPLKTCNRVDWYMGMISENSLCAGSESGKVDSCQGDSGGPLVCYFPNENKFYQLGVTSHGYGCGRPKLPGIYVNLAKYTDWIDNRLHGRTTTLCIHHTLTFLTVLLVTFHCTKITPN